MSATLSADTAAVAIQGSLPSQFRTVDELLADARTRLQRVDVYQASDQVRAGARFVDIRPGWQRASEGEIPGSLIVERNHLEWRLHPLSDARLPWAAPDQRWIVVCSEGYTSSLAAAALVSLGVTATDLIGGVHAWAAAGLELTSPVGPDGTPTPVEQIVGVLADQPGRSHLVGQTPAAPTAVH